MTEADLFPPDSVRNVASRPAGEPRGRMPHDCLGRAIDDVLWGLHNRAKDPDPTWQYEAHCIYQRADSAGLFVVARSRNGAGEQVYRPIHKDGGRWFVGDPPGPLPLYRLTGLAGAGRVYLAEGEKVCDLARSLGLVATASAHGAKAPHNDLPHEFWALGRGYLRRASNSAGLQ